MVGLFSLLDAILKISMGELLRRIEMSDEVRRALLARSGPYAPTIQMVEAYERGSWAVVSAECETLGIDPSTLPAAYIDATGWTRARLEQSS